MLYSVEDLAIINIMIWIRLLCESAKIFIENDFRRDGELLPGLLDIFLGDYYSKMFILFQYQGEIIGSLLCMRYIRESHIIIQLFILIWILLMY